MQVTGLEFSGRDGKVVQARARPSLSLGTAPPSIRIFVRSFAALFETPKWALPPRRAERFPVEDPRPCIAGI